ncbi:DUF2945 domain-containing protein [Niabella sp. W65]|nr:DUF2945 domain-containing protein [Niabella sp. W65]MCH7361539.1 DUF2945 domain-containing protein [Niabella sp. W65]
MAGRWHRSLLKWIDICSRIGMKHSFKVGDHVSWNSEAGHVSGIITGIHRSDFNWKGYTHHATPDDPQYEIKSDKTDHVAVHKAKALQKIN